MKTCDAHELLLTNLTEIKDGQKQLFDLDRSKAEQLSALEVTVAAGFARLEAQLSKKLRDRTQWTPKAVIALVSSLFGSGGVGYAIAMFVIGRIGQ